MLEDYAEKNGFTDIRHFTDDGISGTTFDREGIQAMLAEVEKGNIGTIIIKDMSRLGRNYVQMGMLRKQLRRAYVRLIAVTEGVDTGSGFDDDFLPFRDVINEYYAKGIRNCSNSCKNIKSTFKAKGESGKHVASSPPYGYLKENRGIAQSREIPIQNILQSNHWQLTGEKITKRRQNVTAINHINQF